MAGGLGQETAEALTFMRQFFRYVFLAHGAPTQTKYIYTTITQGKQSKRLASLRWRKALAHALAGCLEKSSQEFAASRAASSLDKSSSAASLNELSSWRKYCFAQSALVLAR